MCIINSSIKPRICGVIYDLIMSSSNDTGKYCHWAGRYRLNNKYTSLLKSSSSLVFLHRSIRWWCRRGTTSNQLYSFESIEAVKGWLRIGRKVHQLQRLLRLFWDCFHTIHFDSVQFGDQLVLVGKKCGRKKFVQNSGNELILMPGWSTTISCNKQTI